MKKLIIAAATAGMVLVASRADAMTCTTTVMMPGGDGAEPFAALDHPDVCVQAQDELFSNFQFGDLPIATGGVTFALETLPGENNHDITFTDQFLAGHTYTGFGYTVSSTAPNLSALLADFTQTTGGPSILTETATPNGTGSIDLDKTKQFPTLSSTVEIDYAPDLLSLIVTETISVGRRSNVSAIEDTIVEQVPEPNTLLLLGGATVAVRLARRRREVG